MISQVQARSADVPPLAFYTVADSRYFPGVAALIASLRLLGHLEPVRLLDCGLEEWQRAALEREATVVAATEARLPHLQKFVLPLERPADVMVVVDGDVILTRRLDELVEVAAAGCVVAFADRVGDRHFPQWRELLSLEDVPRRTYVNTGLLLLPRGLGVSLLEHVQARVRLVDTSLIALADGPADYPLGYPDQDLFNAVLAAQTRPEHVVVLDARLAPPAPFAGLRVADAARLRCRYPDGEEPFALHHIEVKRWLAPTAASPYTRLLTRLLLDQSAPVPVDPYRLPLRLRAGSVAAPASAWSAVRAAARDARRRLRLLARRLFDAARTRVPASAGAR